MKDWTIKVILKSRVKYLWSTNRSFNEDTRTKDMINEVGKWFLFRKIKREIQKKIIKNLKKNIKEKISLDLILLSRNIFCVKLVKPNLDKVVKIVNWDIRSINSPKV